MTAAVIAGISIGSVVGVGIAIMLVFVCIDLRRVSRARKQLLRKQWEVDAMYHGLPEFVGPENGEEEKRYFTGKVRALWRIVGIGRK